MTASPLPPVLPLPAGPRYLDWPEPDPNGAPIEEIRQIRDELARRVADLLAELLPVTSS